MVRLALAYLAGLAALAGFFASGSDSAVDDFGFFFLISAAASLPVVAVLLVLVASFARWVEDNIVIFVLGGPVVVCLGGAALAGSAMLGPLAVCTGTASLVFGALRFVDWPRAQDGPA
jgi:hypothetical protein